MSQVYTQWRTLGQILGGGEQTYCFDKMTSHISIVLEQKTIVFRHCLYFSILLARQFMCRPAEYLQSHKPFASLKYHRRTYLDFSSPLVCTVVPAAVLACLLELYDALLYVFLRAALGALCC